MAGLDPQDMIEELQANIKTGDALKAQLVLAHLGEIDEQSRNKLIYLLSRAEVDFSIPLFLYLLIHQAVVVEKMPVI
ncbi:MAG TPA: response regulator, partial [Desulforhopalus sp.]|nr:response regulator [Desulforhopalus sp.]